MPMRIELADADGHIIEPGDLWVERLPERSARRSRRTSIATRRASSTQSIYGIDIETLDVMHGGIRPRTCSRTWVSPARWASPLERVFVDRRARAAHHPRCARAWAIDGRERLAFNTEPRGVARGPLSDLHARGRDVSAAPRARRVPVYNDWIARRVLRRLGRPSDPGRDAADHRRRRGGRRGPARRREGLPGGLHPHQPGARQEVLRPRASTRSGRRSSTPA